MQAITALFRKLLVARGLHWLYTDMLVQRCGIPRHEARAMVRDALCQCTEQGRKEGTYRLPPGFGDKLVALADILPQAPLIVSAARNDGATGEDIREWWNLHDLQRRMVLWSEQVFRYAVFTGMLDEGLSADEAMQQVRRGFPMYGDPTDTTHTQGDDRPLRHELRGRVDRYREKWGAAVIEERLAGYSSYNAFVRAELRRGNL